jgi:hypothetical protein
VHGTVVLMRRDVRRAQYDGSITVPTCQQSQFVGYNQFLSQADNVGVYRFETSSTDAIHEKKTEYRCPEVRSLRFCVTAPTTTTEGTSGSRSVVALLQVQLLLPVVQASTITTYADFIVLGCPNCFHAEVFVSKRRRRYTKHQRYPFSRWTRRKRRYKDECHGRGGGRGGEPRPAGASQFAHKHLKSDEPFVNGDLRAESIFILQANDHELRCVRRVRSTKRAAASESSFRGFTRGKPTRPCDLENTEPDTDPGSLSFRGGGVWIVYLTCNRFVTNAVFRCEDA